MYARHHHNNNGRLQVRDEHRVECAANFAQHQHAVRCDRIGYGAVVPIARRWQLRFIPKLRGILEHPEM